jgi:hypothetical protein
LGSSRLCRPLGSSSDSLFGLTLGLLGPSVRLLNALLRLLLRLLGALAQHGHVLVVGCLLLASLRALCLLLVPGGPLVGEGRPLLLPGRAVVVMRLSEGGVGLAGLAHLALELGNPGLELAVARTQLVGFATVDDGASGGNRLETVSFAAVVELVSEFVTLLGGATHLDHDVVEEVVDLALVVATTELRGGERLVQDVLG